MWRLGWDPETVGGSGRPGMEWWSAAPPLTHSVMGAPFVWPGGPVFRLPLTSCAELHRSQWNTCTETREAQRDNMLDFGGGGWAKTDWNHPASTMNLRNPKVIETVNIISAPQLWCGVHVTSLRLKVHEKDSLFWMRVLRLLHYPLNEEQIEFNAFKKRCSGNLSQPLSESYFNIKEWTFSQSGFISLHSDPKIDISIKLRHS